MRIYNTKRGVSRQKIAVEGEQVERNQYGFGCDKLLHTQV